MATTEPAWVPRACTLPAAARPLRLAEFDALLTASLRRQYRPSPARLRWLLDPAAEPAARDLAGRESQCCPFFTFGFARDDDGVWLTVDVPPAHVDVLDALAGLAAARRLP